MAYLCIAMKKKFGIYILIITLVMLGLLWVQYFWIDYSINLRNNELSRQLNGALEEVANESEEYYFCFKYYADLHLDTNEGFYMLRHKASQAGAFLDAKGEGFPVMDTIEAYLPVPSRDTVYRTNTFLVPGPVNVKMELNFEFDYARTLNLEDSLGGFRTWLLDQYKNTLTDPESGERIIDTVFLRRTMKEKLSEAGLDTNYFYGLSEAGKDSLLYISSSAVSAARLLGSDLKTVMYNEDDRFSRAYTLYLYVPDRNILLIRKIWLVLLSSVAIIIILAWILVFFVRAIINQRKLNEMKSDFINNMTHEFNTPVSNINLALDTIEKQYNGSTDRLWKIIREENRRIKENISLILQTSALERKKMIISKEVIDLKALVLKVVNTFHFKVEEQGGSLTVNFLVDEAYVLMDEQQMMHLLHNLLDNAIKYSGSRPEIELMLKKITGGFAIVVKDKGIGIREDDILKIFDKFYRVSTGKVHDVKGFGLGLHYVKQVVDAHEGRIHVKSKPGKGSEFIVHLPEQ